MALLLLWVGASCTRGSPAPSSPGNKVTTARVSALPREALLVTSGNTLLEAALLTITESFDTVSPAEFDRGVADGAFANYGVIILDEHTPRLLPPSVGALYFDPSGDQAPFRIVARAKKPAVVAVDEHHQVTHFVTLSSATFDDVEILDVDQARGDTALAITDMGTIIAAGTIAGRRVVACGFALGSTDLPLRTAFPLFLRNAMKWLAGKPQADSR